MLIIDKCLVNKVKSCLIEFVSEYEPVSRISLLNYLPLCLRALRALRAFVLSCLTRLRALRALFRRLTYAPCVYLSRALRALFVHVKIVLGWIFSPAKTSKNSKELFEELLKELLAVLF